MTDDEPRIEREEPVGTPVVRGDPELTGSHADRAVAFDPDDPESVAEAADVVADFAAADGSEDADDEDRLFVLRGAAAAAALVRGEGSYKAAAERAGEGVTVSFLRTWARVHDLPIAIRRHIAVGDIAPTAAKHVARVTGNARFVLAWSVLDYDLTVDQVRRIASEVSEGRPIEEALFDRGVTPGRIELTLPLPVYRELRRAACLSYETPSAVVATAFEHWNETRPDERT